MAAVRAIGLVKRFETTCAVDGVDLMVEPGEVRVSLAWRLCALPLLAFASIAVLFSVTTRNGIVGVLGPAVVDLVMQLLALVGTGVWLHLLLGVHADRVHPPARGDAVPADTGQL